MKRSKKTYILAFVIPIAIILIHIMSMELLKGNYIRKGENFLLADMASQYNSIYAYIWDVLRGNDSIFYSFGKGLGGNMASTIGYYASSPLNILYLLCPKLEIPSMTFIIYLIKIGLCGLCMNIYLDKKFNSKSSIIFSLIYSLSAYTVNYYFNNMWLDVLYLAPLVMLGIDKLINTKSIAFYTIFLALAIIFNFYIAYMLCIFCVIYFIYQLFLKYKIKEFKKYKSIIFRFALASLLAGGISLFWLLPVIMNLKEVMRFSLDKFLLNINFHTFLKDFLSNILPKIYLGSHNTTSVLSRNRPNLYSGMLPLILTFMYFCNKNIKVKERIISAVILLFFIASFMIPHLNLFWQAGSFPNGYICRYSFLYTFFLLLLSARCFTNLGKIKIRYFVIFILIYTFLTYKVSTQYLVFIEKSDLIISSIFILIYLIILGLKMYLKKDKIKKALNILLLIAVIIELFINFKLCFLTNSDMKMTGSYHNYYEGACPVLNNLDPKFHRVDGEYRYSYLDSWVCKNNTLTTSLSTNNGDLYRFWMNNGGSVTYTTIFYDLNKLPIFDSLFGVEYVFSDDELQDSLYKFETNFTVKKFSYVKNNEEIKTKYVYKNPYALSLGYLIPKNNQKIYKSIKTKNSYQSLNRLMKTLTGNDKDVLIPYKQKYKGKGIYELDINNDSKYIYISFDYDVSINWTIYDSIYINDEYVTSSNSEEIGHIKLDNKYPNSKINIKVGSTETKEKPKPMVAYYMDLDTFKEDINILKKHQLKSVEVKGNKVRGKIKVDKPSTLFTSIPYEKGWKVYVDGKKTSYNKVAGEFIGIDLNKGKHTIKMVYYPHHLGIGIIGSILSIGILLLYERLYRKNVK